MDHKTKQTTIVRHHCILTNHLLSLLLDPGLRLLYSQPQIGHICHSHKFPCKEVELDEL